MKANYLLAICIGVSIAVAACKEKEVDSKFITVSSPKAHQTVYDKDSIIVEAVIKPENNAKVLRYTIAVKNKHDKLLFTQNKSCDCKLMTEVKIREAFKYDIDKTSDVYLEIIAMLDNNSETREKVPFILHE